MPDVSLISLNFKPFRMYWKLCHVNLQYNLSILDPPKKHYLQDLSWNNCWDNSMNRLCHELLRLLLLLDPFETTIHIFFKNWLHQLQKYILPLPAVAAPPIVANIIDPGTNNKYGSLNASRPKPKNNMIQLLF